MTAIVPAYETELEYGKLPRVRGWMRAALKASQDATVPF